MQHPALTVCFHFLKTHFQLIRMPSNKNLLPCGTDDSPFEGLELLTCTFKRVSPEKEVGDRARVCFCKDQQICSIHYLDI